MVDLHERYGSTGEKYCDQEEKFPSPDITERSYQWSREEGHEAFDAHDEAVHQEGVVGEGLVEHGDHGGGEETPGKELKEDHHQGVVD